MAEALGIAAAALQIADTAFKFKKLCSDIKNASQDLHCLAEEVAVLATLLGDVEKSTVFNLSTSSSGWEHCFHLFKSSAKSMSQITAELEKTLRSHKVTWPVRIFLKKDELNRCKDRLERTKGIMMLAQQAYSSAVLAQQNETILHEIRAVAMCQNLQAANFSPSINVTGTIKHIGHHELHQGNEETDSNREVIQYHQPRSVFRKAPSSYNLRVPRWIFSKGLQILLHRSNQSWGFTIRTYNQVPYESQVFRLAESGSWDSVRCLLDLGEASPWDVDPDGLTLLHVAVERYDTDALSFLLNLGLDPSYRTAKGFDTLDYLSDTVYWDSYTSHKERREVADMISILLSHPQFVIEPRNFFLMDRTTKYWGNECSSLSLLFNAMTPRYATSGKLSRAVLACSTYTMDAEVVMLMLGPDLTLHQAFDELSKGSHGVSHRYLLYIASSALAYHSTLPPYDQTAIDKWEAIIGSTVEYETRSRSCVPYYSALAMFLHSHCISVEWSACHGKSRVMHWNDFFTKIGRIWIDLLQRLGADLLRYGKAEKAFWSSGHSFSVCYETNRDTKQGYCFNFRNLVYGPEVCDWFFYAVPVASSQTGSCCQEYEMAGQFWDWVENPELFEIPGAFIADEEMAHNKYEPVYIQAPTL